MSKSLVVICDSCGSLIPKPAGRINVYGADLAEVAGAWDVCNPKCLAVLFSDANIINLMAKKKKKKKAPPVTQKEPAQ